MKLVLLSASVAVFYVIISLLAFYINLVLVYKGVGSRMPIIGPVHWQ